MQQVLLIALGLFAFVQMGLCTCTTKPATVPATASVGPAINSACTAPLVCYNDGTADLCYSTGCVDAYPANCPTWVGNGFCSGSQYTFQQKQQYCASSCGLCGSTPPPFECRDNSTNCAAWNGNGFCSSSYYTTGYKQAICRRTCGYCVIG